MSKNKEETRMLHKIEESGSDLIYNQLFYLNVIWTDPNNSLFLFSLE